MRYEFHPDAQAEFIEAAAYYETEVPGLGERFGDEVRRGIELLMNQPEIAPRIDAQLRRLVLTRFPYSLIFAVTSDAIQIIAIAHAHRRPGYWQLRAGAY